MRMTKYESFMLAVALLFIALLLFLPFVLGFEGSSSSYNVSSKFDSVAGSDNSTSSTSFLQRFIGGIQTVANYTSSLFTGRFGILSSGGVTVQQTNTCGNLSTPDVVYNLTQSINATGSCFNITANNVTLSCNGFTINYTRSANGYAVFNNGYNDSIVENCIIVQGRTNSVNSSAIYFLNGIGNNRTVFINNTITTIGSTTVNAFNHGVLLSTYRLVNLTDNRIVTKGRNGYGVYAYLGSDRIFLFNNNITTTAVAGFGVQIIGSSSGVFVRNNITTQASQSRGLSFEVNASFHNVLHNNISTLVSNSPALRIATNNRYLNITNNTLSTAGGSSHVIILDTNVSDTRIVNSTIVSFGGSVSGIQLSLTNNTIVHNNSIILYGAGGNGIFLISSVYTNITHNFVFANLTSRGIYMITSSNFAFIVNNTVNSSSYAIQLATINQSTIYNNLFFRLGSPPAASTAYGPNFFNITKTSATNIIGGTNLGGNFWGTSNSLGISQTCSDVNGDSICDNAYSIAGLNVDSLPLTTADNISPTITITSPLNQSF